MLDTDNQIFSITTIVLFAMYGIDTKSGAVITKCGHQSGLEYGSVQ